MLRFCPNRWFIGTLSVAVLCGCAIVMMACWLSRSKPIDSYADMPDEFKSMIRIANADITDAKVAERYRYLDSEHVWRMTLSPDQLGRVVYAFEFLPVPLEDAPHSFSSVFPRSWQPPRNANCRFFCTPDFPASSRGPYGDHFLTMYDSRNQLFYVWYKFNF